jgi:hypothetical protein
VLATCIWLMISVYGIKPRNLYHQVKMTSILFGEKEVAVHLMEGKRTTTSQ